MRRPATRVTPARPAASGPVRILGPCRSWSTATGLPIWREAARMRPMVLAWSSWLPWEKLRRATSTPGRSSPSSASGVAVAGPMVATILARRMGPCTFRRRVGSSRSPGCGPRRGALRSGLMEHAALVRRLGKLQRLLEVARAMTAERRLLTLLGTINDAAAGVAEADRCSIFVVDRDRGELWTPVAHGTGEIRIALGAGIAGAVAATGAAIRIPDAYADPRFNPGVDAATGYRTRNILGVPMVNTSGETVGVIQALNRRAGDFGDEDEELLQALAGPAASAIENAVLHEEIERLFERFVQASVTA